MSDDDEAEAAPTNENTLRVFFDRETGRIGGYEYTNALSTRARQGHSDFALPFTVDHLKQKVDVATGSIIEMTADEQRQAQQPAAHEVAAAIHQELTATMETQLPDYPEAARPQWAAYRQALRRLLDVKDPVAAIRAWPPRPDGRQPIQLLEARIG